MGEAPIEFDNKKFKNLEEALDYLSQRKDIVISMEEMNKNRNNSAVYDVDQREYPHNTVLDRLMDQAREKAWAKINEPTHPDYGIVQSLKAEKDGHTIKTRDVRNDVLELANPSPEWAK